MRAGLKNERRSLITYQHRISNIFFTQEIDVIRFIAMSRKKEKFIFNYVLGDE